MVKCNSQNQNWSSVKSAFHWSIYGGTHQLAGRTQYGTGQVRPQRRRGRDRLVDSDASSSASTAASSVSMSVGVTWLVRVPAVAAAAPGTVSRAASGVRSDAASGAASGVVVIR